MGAEKRPNLLEGFSNPRFEILWVQTVKQEQTADELVCRQRVDQLESRWPGRCDPVENPLEPGAVQVQESLHDLLDLPSRAKVRQLLDVIDQGRDLADAIAEVVVVRIH